MSGKKGERKLGRNPFDHRRTSRRKRHVREDPPAAAAFRAELPREETPGRQYLAAEQESSGGDIPPINPAWYLVDLWTGILTEPYFFWKKIGEAALSRKS